MTARYAIYYCPPSGSDLAAFGDRWLGRNPRTGRALQQPTVKSIPADDLAEITKTPRHYGFHGTLKAPFHLADGADEAGLLDAVQTFAHGAMAWDSPGLMVAPLGPFLALVPSAPAPALDALAADCVRTFEPFRAPLSEADRTRRNPDRLTDRQRTHLETWGYPYVFQDFRFHMTLSQPLAHRVRSHAQVALVSLFRDVQTPTFRLDALSVFRQGNTSQAFREIARFPLKPDPDASA